MLLAMSTEENQTIDETIRVFVRQRPLTPYEREGNQGGGDQSGSLVLKNGGSCV